MNLDDLYHALASTQQDLYWPEMWGKVGLNKDTIHSIYDYLARTTPQEQGFRGDALNNKYLGINDTIPDGFKTARGVMNKAVNSRQLENSLTLHELINNGLPNPNIYETSSGLMEFLQKSFSASAFMPPINFTQRELEQNWGNASNRTILGPKGT